MTRASTTVHLSANQPADRFYAGGRKIRGFRGEAAHGDRVPEDWVASTTTLFGESELGLSELPDGRRLVDAVREDPEYWLGHEHVRAFGADTMLLVKLLDAGQRLPVHLHPERAFASEHLGRRHGKAEAWYMLEGGRVHLGFRRHVERAELARWVADQDIDAMIDAMHAVDVAAGDSVYVPPGTPHAIGAGVFLVEVQEPEDLSILLEWRGFGIDGETDGHLGIGFDTALGATDRQGCSVGQIETLITRQGSGERTLADGSEQYFRAERVEVDGRASFDAGFSVCVVTDGAGELHRVNATAAPLTRGDTVLVPHAAGAFEITGTLTLVRCRPPRPATMPAY